MQFSSISTAAVRRNGKGSARTRAAAPNSSESGLYIRTGWEQRFCVGSCTQHNNNYYCYYYCLDLDRLCCVDRKHYTTTVRRAYIQHRNQYVTAYYLAATMCVLRVYQSIRTSTGSHTGIFVRSETPSCAHKTTSGWFRERKLLLFLYANSFSTSRKKVPASVPLPCVGERLPYE